MSKTSVISSIVGDTAGDKKALQASAKLTETAAQKALEAYQVEVRGLLDDAVIVGCSGKDIADNIYHAVVRARVAGIPRDAVEAEFKAVENDGVLYWLNSPITENSFADSVGKYGSAISLALTHKITMIDSENHVIKYQDLLALVAPHRAKQQPKAKKGANKLGKDSQETPAPSTSVVNVGDALDWLIANPSDENIGAHQTALRKLGELVAAYDKARAMPPVKAAPKALTKAQVRELGKLARLEAGRMAEAA